MVYLFYTTYINVYLANHEIFRAKVGKVGINGFLLKHCGSSHLTLYLLVSSADNICKQFGPRSGPTF